jgi:hypothetical protein
LNISYFHHVLAGISLISMLAAMGFALVFDTNSVLNKLIILDS